MSLSSQRTLTRSHRYANQSATDEEVFDACRAASIHDRILAFADGYATKVGERGVRLSGGERQRVAIARTLIKNPKITLLDEATAALDVETEEKIQEAFSSLSSGGTRTMLIIAHRLSTITRADQILVLHNGSVIESGTHQELIEQGGKYARMWRKQSKVQEAQRHAEELRSRAQKAIDEAEVDSASVSEDEVDGAKQRRDKSAGAASASGSGQAGARGHRRVNFSQSSLGRSSLAYEDGDPEARRQSPGEENRKPPGER